MNVQVAMPSDISVDPTPGDEDQAALQIIKVTL